MDDAQAIFDGYAQDAEVCRYLSWRPHRSLGDTEAYVRMCLESTTSRTYALLRRETDGVVGTFDVRAVGRTKLGFGYVLARPHWGKGLMTEALIEVAAWALRQPSIWRIGDVVDVDNRASARVMEKAGLEREGVLRRWGVHPNMSDVPRDCISYAKVR
jgi:ribosomal-protein-alanine N-acetyltransferase